MRRAALLTSLLATATLTAVADAQYTLAGRIELPGGDPAAGVAIELIAQTNAYDFGRLVLAGRHYPEPAGRSATGPDGSFELRAPEGMWELYVAPEGYRPMELKILVTEDRRLPTLELIAETPVAVTVTGADGEPLAGAHLRAEPPPRPARWTGRPDGWRPAYRQTLTDERGTAEIGRGADEPLHIYAIGAGHLEAERDGVQAGSVELRLEAATPRRIRVQDPGEQPVAEALVRLGERRWPIGLTDTDGMIELPLPAAGDAKLHAIGRHGERGESRLELGADRPDEIPTLTVKPEHRIAGRMVDRESRRGIPGGYAWLSGRGADAVRTDADGAFALSAPSEDFWVWGTAPGYIKEFTRVDSGGQPAAGASAAREITVALQAAIEARGVVVDESDQPVADAAVTVSLDPMARGSRTAWRAATALDPAVSDLEGRFSIGNLHPEVSYLLRAAKPGFAPTEIQLHEPRADAAAGLRLVLERGRVAIGSVLSVDGQPIAGARIELRKSIGAGPMRRVMLARALGEETGIEARSDETGRFELRDLSPGIFDLEVSASGYAAASIPAVEVLAEAGETDVGEITLEPGAAIEGRVTDARGSAVEGARVFAAPAESEQAFMMIVRDREGEPAAVTDASGFFSVPDRRAGEKVDLSVKAAGYARAKILGVEAPTYRPLAVRLNRSSQVRGEVVDASGRPIGGANVWLQVSVTMGRTSGSQSSSRTTTGDDGRFVLDDVDPGEIGLSVQAEGYRSAQLGNLVVEPERDLEDVRVVMEPGAVISGRVTDASGRPVQDAMVMVSETGMSHSMGSAGRTDAEGRYRLDGVAPGRVSVTARHESHQPSTRELRVELGENTLDFVFEGGATLSGRVLDESGQPVAGAEVQLAPTTVMRWEGQGDSTDGRGEFSIGGVPEGVLTLQAMKEGFATASLEGLEVGPGDLAGLEIRLSPGAAIVGRILGLEPAEYASVQLMAVRRPGVFSIGRVDRDGNYRIEDLGPGDYDVYARVGQGSRVAQANVTVVEGIDETLQDLEFESGLTLTGVVLRRGEPVAGALVGAAGLDVGSTSAGSTSSEGRFELSGLKPGRHILTVSNFQSGLSHREELELGSDLDIVVRLEVAVVSGVVLDATSSRPIAGAMVRLESADDEAPYAGFAVHANVTTDSTGYFRFGEVSAGAHRMVAQKDGYAPAETALTVIEGLDQEGLELLMEPTEGVRILVFLPSGQPAPEFFAAVLDTAGRSLLSGVYTAGDQGSHLSVPPGDWELLVSARDTAVSSTRITVPSDPIAISLQPPATLAIRVPALEGDSGLAIVKLTRPDGREFRNLQWMWTRGSWQVDRGRASVEGIEPGTWTVTVEAPDGRVWQAQVSLAAGANPELVLQ